MDDDDLFFFPNRGSYDLYIGDCIEILTAQLAAGIQYDSIITDPPYEIGLHAKEWDSTGIAFSPILWKLFFDLIKPGGFVLSFGASRMYHRLAVAGEDAGFKVYPFLTWTFDGGLPKPVNVSELFDRDNVPDRKKVGTRAGSGFTSANVSQGAQNRSKTDFAAYERYVSQESKDWKGYHYGVNALKPVMEPIFIGQKPISEKRMIDNIRKHGTGALNLGAIEEKRNLWPTTEFHHKKARKTDHGSSHPSVKPVALMEELCLLACPTGGHILDPFAGTGTTAIAAVNNGFRCTLVEQNPEMEEVIRRRLS
jgi:DNA modification methylase